MTHPKGYKQFRIAGMFLALLFVGSVLLIKPFHHIFTHHEHSCCEENTVHNGHEDCQICAFHFNPFLSDTADVTIAKVELLVCELADLYVSALFATTTDVVSLRAPPVFIL